MAIILGKGPSVRAFRLKGAGASMCYTSAIMWPKALSRILSHVVLHVTNRCDLACNACFVKKGNRDLSLESARIIAGKLGKVGWLDIGGGEPFLVDHLGPVCRAFDTRSITIPTNGQRTAPICEKVEELLETWPGQLTVAVSLDGVESDNDAVRGAGTFRNAVATMEKLRRLPRLILKVNTVVCQATIGNLLPFMAYVKRELAPDYHSLLLLRGSPASEEQKLPPLELLARCTPAILDLWKSYDYADGNPLTRRLKRNYQRYYWQTALATLAKQKCHVPCKAPRLHKVIYPDGAVSMCELTPPVGNILAEPLGTIEEKLRRGLRDYEKANGPCFCTHNCNMGENILAHPASVVRIVTGRANA